MKENVEISVEMNSKETLTFLMIFSDFSHVLDFREMYRLVLSSSVGFSHTVRFFGPLEFILIEI